MRRTIATILVVTSTSCLLSDEDGDGTNYVAVTQIEAAFKDANCTYLTNCGLFPDKATCLSAELGSSGLNFTIDANIVAAVGAGLVIYNGSNVKECFDALAARSCDETSESARATPFACRDFIRGTGLSGEMCTIDAQCVSLQCSAGSSGNTCTMGVCIGDTPPNREPAAIGSQCSTASGCVPGAYCDSLSDICAALKATGEVCTQANECGYGLGCVGSTGTRTCQTVPAIGQSCATDGVCRDEGSYCNFTTGLCAQLGTQMSICNSSTQCSPYYPCDFAAGQCLMGPSLGEPCSSGVRCFDEGTYCDFNTSVCTALKSNGLECSNDSECVSDFCDTNQVTPLCSQPTICF